MTTIKLVNPECERCHRAVIQEVEDTNQRGREFYHLGPDAVIDFQAGRVTFKIENTAPGEQTTTSVRFCNCNQL